MGIGFSELMVILIIIMIIFGAGKLPEIGSAFGRSIRNFKTSMKEAEEADKVDAAATGGQTAQLDEKTKEEQEKLAREKLQAELAERDKKREQEAAAFTASLPKSGSYDFAKDQEKKV